MVNISVVFVYRSAIINKRKMFRLLDLAKSISYAATYKVTTVVATNISNTLADTFVTTSTTSNGTSLLDIIVAGVLTNSDLL